MTEFCVVFYSKKPVSNFPIGRKLRDQLPRSYWGLDSDLLLMNYDFRGEVSGIKEFWIVVMIF